MADNDAQIELKKRARRRLVGATALALAAAIVLPMVMDSSPRLANSELQVRIPGQEGGNFTARPVNAASAPVAAQSTSLPVAGPAAPDASSVASVERMRAAQHRKPGDALPPPTGAGSAPAAGASAVSPALVPPAATSMPATAVSGAVAAVPTAQIKPPATVAPPQHPHSEKKPSEEKSPAKKPEPAPPKKQPPKHAEEEDRARAILEDRPSEAPAPAKSGPVFVQLGVYRDEANAQEAKAKAGAHGMAASLSKSGDNTRVRVGPFADRAAAEAALARLKQAGISAIIVSK